MRERPPKNKRCLCFFFVFFFFISFAAQHPSSINSDASLISLLLKSTIVVFPELSSHFATILVQIYGACDRDCRWAPLLHDAQMLCFMDEDIAKRLVDEPQVAALINGVGNVVR
jgi:hypothetical protein